MIGLCVSLCDNVNGQCTGCGRTMKEKQEWKLADGDETIHKRIAEDARSRLDKSQLKRWTKLYEKKKIRIGESK